MSERGKRDGDSGRISRRRFVKAAGASSIAVGLAGCTGGGDGGGEPTDNDTPISTDAPDEEVTIQLATDSNFKEAGDKITKTLRENGGLPDNVKLEWVAGSFDSGDRQAKYQQLLSTGQESPTIMMMDNGWTIPFIARNQLQNLSKSLPSDITNQVKDNYFEAMTATAQGQNGDLYGVPLFVDFPTIQYRKDLLREAGYTDSDFEEWATNPPTWKEFSKIVSDGMGPLEDSLDDPSNAQGFNWQGAAYVGLACCDFVEFMGSWGGSYFGARENLFGPIGDRPVTVEEEPVINAIKMMRTFINGQSDDQSLSGYENISPQAVVQYKEESSRKPFTEGKAVALRNWPYSIGINGAEDVFGEDLGVMPIPYAVEEGSGKYDGIGGSTSALGGWHLTMNPNASSKKKQAAVQVFKALQNEQVRLDLFEIGGWIPPIPELFESDQAKELDLFGRYVESLKVAGENALPRPVTAIWPKQSSQISKEVNASIRKQKTPKEAMASLKKSLESLEQQASQS